MININEIDKINSVNLTLSNKNADNKKIHPNFEIINDTSIVVYDINETYNVLKMKIETNKGPHRTKFALLGDQTFKETTNLTKEIQGYTSINHNDEGISIIFNENQFSNESPYLTYKKDGKLNRKKMNRKSQNQLISEIFTIAVEFSSSIVNKRSLD